MSIHENLLGGPAPTHLPDDPEPRELLASGAAPAEVAAKYPASSLAWAQLADDAFEGGRVVESYAYARTGYHRGLDALRRAGHRRGRGVRALHRLPTGQRPARRGHPELTAPPTGGGRPR
jgi:hypothetical protein